VFEIGSLDFGVKGEDVMEEKLSFRGFLGRVLYKASGMKVISFLLSGAAVIILVVLSNDFSGKVSDAVVLKAIDAVKDLAIALFIVKGGQNIVGMIKGNGSQNKNNNGS